MILTIIYDFVVDWLSDDSTLEPPAKRAKKAPADEFKDFYNKLKAELDNACNMNSSAGATEDLQSLPDDATMLKEQLQREDKNSLHKDTEHFYRAGVLLAKIKYQCFKKCDKCTSRVDTCIFEVVMCKGCTKVSNGNTFFQDVKQLKLEKLKKNSGGTISDDYINFFIRFASLCHKYPKLRLITWNAALKSTCVA